MPEAPQAILDSARMTVTESKVEEDFYATQHNNEFGKQRIRSIPNSLLCLVMARLASRVANLRRPIL